MTSEQNLRWAGFITASFLVHAVALSWLDFSGADLGRLPSKLTVLLQSNGESEVSEMRQSPASASRTRDLFVRPPAEVAKRPAARPANNTPAATTPETETTSVTKVTRAAATRAEKLEASSRENKVTAASQPRLPQANVTETASAPITVAGAEPGSAEEPYRQPAQLAAAKSSPEAAPDGSEDSAAKQRGQLLSLLHEAISREKRYPMLALRQRREGTATVSFSLSPSGEMDAIGIDRSSGFSVLDTAAVSAVSRVAPFAPARLLLSDVTRFKVNVTFQLN